MFTEENLNILTIETNHYLNSKPRSTKVPVITNGEMRRFIGILIYMSIVKVPKYRNYFNGPNRQESVSNAMKISRFEQILNNLHMNDNDLQPKRGDARFDTLYKFRPLLSNFERAFDEGAQPEPHVFVEEMLAPAKGRVPGRIYMPNKPYKRGFQLWSLAGARSGYVKKFQILGDNLLQHEVVESSIGASGRVVLELAEKMPPGTNFYFDNYFASPLLAYKLKQRGQDATCTLRGNRKSGADKFLMSEQEMRKKGRGTVDSVCCNGILVTQWYDRKLVIVASTKYSTFPKDNVERCSSNKGTSINMKTKKWYKKLLYFFIDLCVSNAYACFKADYPEKNLDFLEFKTEVSHSLMRKIDLGPGAELDLPPPQQSADFVCDEVRLDRVDHLPSWVDGGKTSKVFGKHCKIRGCKGHTRSYCMKCKVFLCNSAVKKCYYKWHTATRS